MRILVVDDEPAVREAVERALQLEGYEVTTAADGHEALQASDEQPADAVVLDVLMPRLDGIQVCRRLREKGDRTPVLMLTARDAVGDRVTRPRRRRRRLPRQALRARRAAGAAARPAAAGVAERRRTGRSPSPT